jgi:hypothetical protein
MSFMPAILFDMGRTISPPDFEELKRTSTCHTSNYSGEERPANHVQTTDVVVQNDTQARGHLTVCTHETNTRFAWPCVRYNTEALDKAGELFFRVRHNISFRLKISFTNFEDKTVHQCEEVSIPFINGQNSKGVTISLSQIFNKYIYKAPQSQSSCTIL